MRISKVRLAPIGALCAGVGVVVGACGVAPDGAASPGDDSVVLPVVAVAASLTAETVTVPVAEAFPVVEAAPVVEPTTQTEADGEVHGTVVITPAAVVDGAVRVDPPEPEIPEPDIVDLENDPTAGIEQVWLDLAECESNQRWDYNGSSGYDGGLQFHPNTWTGMGGDDFAPYAWQATPFEQVTVAKRLLEVQGWGAWPTCSRKLGLR